jgi:spore maturation protein CgeB
MDILLSPNRTFKSLNNLMKQYMSFDGFPLGADAAACGTALFVSDELNSRRDYFKDKKHLIIIDNKVEDIIEKIEYYYNNLDELYKLSKNGQERILELLDTDFQINERIKILKEFIDVY